MANLPDVKINIVAGGVEQVSAAFKSIEDRATLLSERLVKVQKSGASRGTNEHVKAAGETNKQLEAMSRKREQAKEREFAKLTSLTKKWAQDEIREEKRKNAAIESESKKSAQARARFFQGVARDSFNNLRNMANTAKNVIGAALAVGGGFSIVDSVRSEASANGKAREISNNSSIGGSKGVSKESVLRKAESLTAKGFTKEEALGGLDSFIAKAGNAEMAMRTIEELGDLANATGADLKSLATTAGEAWNALSDDEKKLGGSAIMKMMRNQAGQALVGALDPKETAGNWGRVFASAAQFQGGATRNAAYLGAMAQQSSMGGTSIDSAEATESAKSLSMDINTHSKELAKAGITGLTYGPANQLKDIKTVFEKLMVGTGGDLGKLEQAGMGRRSTRIFEASSNVYKNAYVNALSQGKGTKEAHQAGMSATEAKLNEIANATMTQEEIKKKAALRVAEVDKQLIIVMEDLKTKVGSQLLPVVAQLIPKLAEAIPHIANFIQAMIKLADWITVNPLQAAFLSLGAVVLKSVTEAFASNVIQKIIKGSFASAGGTAALATAAYVASVIGDAIMEAKSEGRDPVRKQANALNNEEKRLNIELDNAHKNGDVKAEEDIEKQLAKIQLKKKELNVKIEQANKLVGTTDDIGGTALDLLGTAKKGLNSNAMGALDSVNGGAFIIDKILGTRMQELTLHWQEESKERYVTRELATEGNKYIQDLTTALRETADVIKFGVSRPNQPDTSGNPNMPDGVK